MSARRGKKKSRPSSLGRCADKAMRVLAEVIETEKAKRRAAEVSDDVIAGVINDIHNGIDNRETRKTLRQIIRQLAQENSELRQHQVAARDQQFMRKFLPPVE